GVIYHLSPAQLLGGQRSRTPSRFDFAAAAGVRLGQFRSIEPRLPDAENRIGRQKAVFIAGFDSHHLQRVSVDVIYFRQLPGETFQDPRLGITRESLLTPEAKLERLAMAARANGPRLSRALTAARIPADDMFGSLGIGLWPNLQKAQS